MATLKTMTNEQLLEQIGNCRTIEELNALHPKIKDEVSGLPENDYAREIIYKMYAFAVHTMKTNPTVYPFLNFNAAAKLPNVEEQKEVRPLKSIEQLVEEDPLHLYNRELDNQYGFWQNGKYFFEQADVTGLLKFLKGDEISKAVDAAGLTKSVKALARFNFTYACTSASDKELKEYRLSTAHIEQKKPFPADLY